MKPEADQPFLVSPELVEFDRRDMPIYHTVPADFACTEPLSWGAPLDRLFGDGEELHIDGTPVGIAADASGFAPDPLVELGTLTDSLPLAPAGAGPIVGPTTEGGSDVHAVAHLPDAWTFDYSGADWTFDGQS